MTSEPPAAATDSAPRPLRRRSSGRVIGGVAAGLADYLNVDPLLIRAAFVGLMIFGGAGLVLYVAGWLLIPAEGHEHSAVDEGLQRLGISGRGIATVVLFAVLGLIVLSVPIGGPVAIDGGAVETWIVLLLIVLGVVLLSRREATPSAQPSVEHPPLRPPVAFGLTPFRLVAAGLLLLVGFYVLLGMELGGGLYLDAWTLIVGIVVILGIMLLRQGGGAPAIATSHAETAAASAAPAAADVAVAAEPRERVPRSPLAWYIIAAALVAIGLLAIVDNGFGATVMPGQFFGAVLAVVGIGLVVGAWWGRARILILPALVVLPFAAAATFVTAPLEGGTGDQAFAPVTADELRSEYRLLGGRLTLDLRELAAGDEPVNIAASVAFGQLAVILPVEARVEIDSEVGAGGSSILGTFQVGTNLVDRYARGAGGPHFVLDLESGIGQVVVGTSEPN